MRLAITPSIAWAISGNDLERVAIGKWQDWAFVVSYNGRGGWNVHINGVQAWTYMNGFEDAMRSVTSRLRDWAYLNQFRVQT